MKSHPASRQSAGSSHAVELNVQADATLSGMRFLRGLVVACALGILGVAVSSGDFWRFHLLPGETVSVFSALAIAYGMLVFAALAWRMLLWRSYQPMAGIRDDELPSVSLVIPAYNEGELVGHAIDAAASSRYPTDRLQILVIDDGSSDDTWQHIRSAVGRWQSKVDITARRLADNVGKRQALYHGFQQAAGQVYVTIDSDSLLQPDALRNAVTPLVRDPAVHCVAGCVESLNSHQNLITRFLKCYYSLSFKFVRAYQNQFRGVFCTPGALSVYRAEVVDKVADEWLNQRFLGRACATGEDRSMTNLILREGGLTAYQGNAIVHTRVPHTYVGMVNMFLRWARSNIRETLVLWQFMFTRFRDRYRNVFRLNMLIVLLSLVLPPIFILHSGALLLASDGFFLRYAGMVILYSGVMAAIYYANEKDGDWAWLLLYNFFWVACLSWILPYAALTLRNTGWLTRGDDMPMDTAINRQPSAIS